MVMCGNRTSTTYGGADDESNVDLVAVRKTLNSSAFSAVTRMAMSSAMRMAWPM
jgi:hypothetical protein